MDSKTEVKPQPLTATELIQHPEFHNTSLNLKPTTAGKVAVASTRGGPIDIAYEIHGTGPTKIIWIMGLGAFKTAWQRQTLYFGHQNADKYSNLVLDNRGMGDSDKPLGRYSTSEMARDTVELLDAVGWKGERELHVVGVSMGGMIAQELGLLIPERICSLTLVSTAARLVNTIGFFENLRNRINLFIPRSIDEQIALAKYNCFGQDWLEKPDQEGGLFPTNGDRFAAQELRKRGDVESFTKKGFLCQAVAAGWHHKSAQQLKELGDKIGRERILVVGGNVDKMITPPHFDVLIKELGGDGPNGIRTKIWDRTGHVCPIEKKDEFNELIAEQCRITEKIT
jgi:pimeloyl-ACP methyl ester carboxylesterase